MRKAEIYEKLRKLGIEHDSTISSPEARQLLKSLLRDNIRPEIVLLATEAGHEVLFTPPRYTDLQPIELVWAHVKGEIRKQYSLSTTFSDIKKRLDTEF